MKKLLILIFLLMASACFAIEDREIEVVYNSYDYGFTDGMRCMMREIKHFLDETQVVTKEEFVLRVEQCRHECKDEILDKVLGKSAK